MLKSSVKRMAAGVTMAACALAFAPSAQAEDFFSALFGGGRPQARSAPMPYASEGDPAYIQQQDVPPRPRVMAYGGGQAFCVRTCDGRYFPVAGADRESKAASCNSFCPASKTELVYGSNIDNATTGGGKPYSELSNAFRYRNEIVDGCTCNGKDQIGLAPVRIEDDPTLRKGDLVAGTDGLKVAGRGADKRGASLNFSPAPKSVLARYSRVPLVAQE